MNLIDALKAIDFKKPSTLSTAVIAVGGVAVQFGFGDAEWFKQLGQLIQENWGFALALGSMFGLKLAGNETK